MANSSRIASGRRFSRSFHKRPGQGRTRARTTVDRVEIAHCLPGELHSELKASMPNCFYQPLAGRCGPRPDRGGFPQHYTVLLSRTSRPDITERTTKRSFSIRPLEDLLGPQPAGFHEQPRRLLRPRQFLGRAFTIRDEQSNGFCFDRRNAVLGSTIPITAFTNRDISRSDVCFR